VKASQQQLHPLSQTNATKDNALPGLGKNKQAHTVRQMPCIDTLLGRSLHHFTSTTSANTLSFLFNWPSFQIYSRPCQTQKGLSIKSLCGMVEQDCTDQIPKVA